MDLEHFSASVLYRKFATFLLRSICNRFEVKYLVVVPPPRAQTLLPRAHPKHLQGQQEKNGACHGRCGEPGAARRGASCWYPSLQRLWVRPHARRWLSRAVRAYRRWPRRSHASPGAWWSAHASQLGVECMRGVVSFVWFVVDGVPRNRTESGWPVMLDICSVCIDWMGAWGCGHVMGELEFPVLSAASLWRT